MNRHRLPAILFVVLVAVLAVGLTLNARLVPSPLIGKALPAFDLPRLIGTEKRLTSKALIGQVSMLNVWATWCVSCRQEHDMLLHIQRQGVPLYGLNYKDQRDSALRWLVQLGNPYEATAVDADGRAALDFGVYGAPETYVIDATGRIAYKHIGPITEAVWRDTLAPLVESLRAQEKRG